MAFDFAAQCFIYLLYRSLGYQIILYAKINCII